MTYLTRFFFKVVISNGRMEWKNICIQTKNFYIFFANNFKNWGSYLEKEKLKIVFKNEKNGLWIWKFFVK